MGGGGKYTINSGFLFGFRKSAAVTGLRMLALLWPMVTSLSPYWKRKVSLNTFYGKLSTSALIWWVPTIMWSHQKSLASNTDSVHYYISTVINWKLTPFVHPFPFVSTTQFALRSAADTNNADTKWGLPSILVFCPSTLPTSRQAQARNMYTRVVIVVYIHKCGMQAILINYALYCRLMVRRFPSYTTQDGSIMTYHPFLVYCPSDKRSTVW